MFDHEKIVRSWPVCDWTYTMSLGHNANQAPKYLKPYPNEVLRLINLVF
jgi:hypothetical protein